MHMEYINNDLIKIYIYDTKKINDKEYIKQNKETYFKTIFLTLKNKYHIKLNGLYKIELYICKNYGIIIELEHENDELYDECIEGVDLKIRINDEYDVVYEIADILTLKDEKNISIFKYKNKYYIKFIIKPTNKQLFKIIEHSNVIYGKITKRITNPYNLTYL